MTSDEVSWGTHRMHLYLADLALCSYIQLEKLGEGTVSRQHVWSVEAGKATLGLTLLSWGACLPVR